MSGCLTCWMITQVSGCLTRWMITQVSGCDRPRAAHLQTPTRSLTSARVEAPLELHARAHSLLTSRDGLVDLQEFQNLMRAEVKRFKQRSGMCTVM